MPLRVYNTLTQAKEPFQTVAPGKVGMYVCGPTVYSPSHIGHMVGPVIFDTIKRYLIYLGLRGHLGRQHHRRRRQADRRGAEGRDDGQGPGRAGHRRLSRVPGGAGGRRHRPHALRHRAHRRDHRDHARADRQGVRLRVGGRRLLRRVQGARVRQAQPPRPRGAAGRRPDRAVGAEAAPGRLRALEELRSRASRRGRAPGARAGPAGTSSAPP